MVKEIQKDDVKAVLKFIVAGYFFDVLNKNSDDKHPTMNFNISDREKEILKMVANGMNNEEIAWKMKAPITVVHSKIDEIFKKLENENRTKNAVFALNNQKFAM